jgi:hypothetical protein
MKNLYDIYLTEAQIETLFETFDTLQKVKILKSFNESETFANFNLCERLVVSLFKDIDNLDESADEVDTKQYILHSIGNIKKIGKFSELVGLEILKTCLPYQFGKISKYELPQSHINYINSFGADDKAIVAKTSFGKYLTDVQFIWSGNFRTSKISECSNYYTINIAPSWQYGNDNFSINVETFEIAQKLQIVLDEFHKKLAFETAKSHWTFQVENVSEKHRRLETFFTPSLEYITKQVDVEVVEIDEDGDSYKTTAKINFTTDIIVVGNFEDIQTFECCEFPRPHLVKHLLSKNVSGRIYYPVDILNNWLAEQEIVIFAQIEMLKIEASYSKYSAKVSHDYKNGFDILLTFENKNKRISSERFEYLDYETASDKLSKFIMC